MQNTTKRSSKKKRRKHSRATVVKDKNEIFCKEVSKVVPIDFVGSTDVYANTYENMSTNLIPMDYSGYKFNLL